MPPSSSGSCFGQRLPVSAVPQRRWQGDETEDEPRTSAGRIARNAASRQGGQAAAGRARSRSRSARLAQLARSRSRIASRARPGLIDTWDPDAAGENVPLEE